MQKSYIVSCMEHRLAPTSPPPFEALGLSIEALHTSVNRRESFDAI